MPDRSVLARSLALTLLVVALAVFRVSRLIVDDSITSRLREWVWVRWPHELWTFEDGLTTTGGSTYSEHGVALENVEGVWFAEKPHWLGGLIACIWCTSFWVGLIAAVAFYFFPEQTYWVSLPFAFSGLAGILHRIG